MTSPLLRVRLDLRYDGTDFSGWAAQPGRRTVEGVLGEALTLLMHAPDPVRLTVAGRTDAGVHARGQVCHADVDLAAWAALPGRSARAPEEALLGRLHGILPGDVAVRRVAVAPDGFDARFSALSRRYLYRLCDLRAAADPLRRRDTVTIRQPLDLAAMRMASERLVGLHDFAAFCRRRAGATTVRTLLRFEWARDDMGVLCSTLEADAFCHSMVRSLVGAVAEVGSGRRRVEWPAEVLRSGQRDGPVMPPQGLCLEEVRYPPEQELATRAAQSRALRSL